MYILCFDLAAAAQDQLGQIRYWLDYLSSILDELPREADYWKVFLVGVQSDLATSKPSSDISILQSTWTNIPLFKKIFITSAKNGDSVQKLLSSVKTECMEIITRSDANRRVPKSYLTMLNFVQNHEKAIVNRCDIPDPSGIKEPVLRHFHSLRDIILLDNELICGRPSEIATIMAKFISPESVQANLLHVTDGVEILTLDEIGKILKVKDKDREVG